MRVEYKYTLFNRDHMSSPALIDQQVSYAYIRAHMFILTYAKNREYLATNTKYKY